MNRILKNLFGTLLVVTFYVAMFSQHWLLGTVMLLSHIGYEVFNHLEQKEFVKQYLNQYLLVDEDKSEPPAREGNC